MLAMSNRIDFRMKLYKPTRVALSVFVCFAFGMGAYAWLNEIGSISQVLQAVAFGAVALGIRLTLFRPPSINPYEKEEGDGDRAA